MVGEIETECIAGLNYCRGVESLKVQCLSEAETWIFVIAPIVRGSRKL